MTISQDFETQFTKVFQPIFLWGVAAFELCLVIYAVYLEFFTGAGPSLISTVLPLSVTIAIGWAVLSVLITLATIGLRKRAGQKDND